MNFDLKFSEEELKRVLKIESNIFFKSLFYDFVYLISRNVSILLIQNPFCRLESYFPARPLT